MSNIVVVSIDGVLGRVGEPLHQAQPNVAGFRLLLGLTSQWQTLGYVTESEVPLAKRWLEEFNAPLHQWIVQANRFNQLSQAQSMLASRLDRMALYVDSDTTHIDGLAAVGVPLVVLHDVPWGLADWREPSSWQNDQIGVQE